MATYENLAIGKLLDGEPELLAELHLDLFTGRNRKIFKLILEYYEDNIKFPSKQLLIADIEARAPAGERGVYTAIVEQSCDTEHQTTSSDAIIRGLRDTFVLKNTDSHIEELLEAQREKDTSKVKSILTQMVEEISIQNVQIGDFKTAMETDDDFFAVPSGFGEEYDEQLGGGLSGLVIFTAKSGGGKTVALLQSALENYKAGKNVLYISLEMSAKVMGNRVKSHLTGIPFSRINSHKAERPTLTKEELEKIDEEMVDFFGRDNLWRVTTDPVDTAELLNIIRVEKQLHDIDIVIIDYLSLISPSKYDKGESWQTMTNMAKALHRLTMREQLVIVTASQINEIKKAKNGVVPEVTTRGTKELEFSSSQMFFLEKSEEQPSEEDGSHVMTMYTMKNRLNMCKHTMFEGKFSTMKLINTGIHIQ